MAANTSAEVTLELVTCPICFDTMRSPMLVTCCGRSFCRECLPKTMRACPLCRAPFKTREMIVVNRSLDELIQHLGIGENDNKTNDVANVCSECQGMFPTPDALAEHMLLHNQQRTAIAAQPPVPRVSEVQAVPPPAPTTQVGQQGLQSGVIDQYDEAKGVGYIKRTGSGANSYRVHFTRSVWADPTVKPARGMAVAFADRRTSKGFSATTVRHAIPPPTTTTGSSSASAVNGSFIPPNSTTRPSASAKTPQRKKQQIENRSTPAALRAQSTPMNADDLLAALTRAMTMKVNSPRRN